MRVVLDANVVIAAFAARGLCESVFEICVAEHRIFVSNHLLTEIEEKLRGKLRLPETVVRELICLLREQGVFVEPAAVPVDAGRDPDDVPILGLAVAAEADCLVTGDKDLIVLESFRQIPIRSPRAFADLLSDAGGNTS